MLCRQPRPNVRVGIANGNVHVDVTETGIGAIKSDTATETRTGRGIVRIVEIILKTVSCSTNSERKKCITPSLNIAAVRPDVRNPRNTTCRGRRVSIGEERLVQRSCKRFPVAFTRRTDSSDNREESGEVLPNTAPRIFDEILTGDNLVGRRIVSSRIVPVRGGTGIVREGRRSNGRRSTVITLRIDNVVAVFPREYRESGTRFRTGRNSTSNGVCGDTLPVLAIASNGRTTPKRLQVVIRRI